MTNHTSRRFPPLALATLALFLAEGAGPSLPSSNQAWAQAPVPPRTQSSNGVLMPVAAPFSLTASDGSGLELVSLSAEAAIEDPLAFTELHLVFRNPEPRVREGRFRITLPPAATISRFAMRVGNRWQEGEVVEQQAARIAYEDFLHRRQDPALLEAEAGNEFSARVFPILPNATKELIVSYSQELTRTSEPYRLPLRGLPRLDSLSIRTLVGKTTPSDGGKPAPASNLGGAHVDNEIIEVVKRNFKPDRDFEVAHTGRAGRSGLRHDNLVVARVVPLVENDRRDDVASLFVLFDTSASRALALADQIGVFENLMSEIRKSGDPVVSVAAFDQDVEPLFTGKASTMGNTVRKRLLERRALGASDLDRALGWLAGAMKAGPETRVLLITDGVVTAGETGADKLRARVKALSSVGVGRLDALAVGGIRDEALLARLVTAGLARNGVVLDGTQPAIALARRMTRATRSGVKVELDGAGWVWPSVLDGVQPGDEILVYADLPANRPFRLKINGAPLALAGTLAAVERPLLERAWVRARISRLIEQRDNVAGSDRDLADALKKQAIELSVRQRVLCPFTSLLVLETEQDYARFGIERRGLADILTVGPGGIALLRRTDFAAPVEPAMGSDQPEALTLQSLSARARPAKKSKAEGAPRTAVSRTMEERETSRRTARPDEAAEKSVGAASRVVASDEPLDSADNFRESPSSAPPRGHANGGNNARGAGAPLGAGAGFGGVRSARPVAAAAAAPPPSAEARKAPHQDDLLDGLLSGTVRRSRQAPAPSSAPAMAYEAQPTSSSAFREEQMAREEPREAPLAGTFQEISALIRAGRAREGLGQALVWRQRDAGDVLALVALGECWEALGDPARAARAYGSIIDLFPGRADMRRFAGERLERIHGTAALALAVDTYRKAVEQRPDHPASHRLLGFALLKQGRAREAFAALAIGLTQKYPPDRFRGVDQILREDLGLAAAAWIHAEPARAVEIRERLVRAGGIAETEPSIRFVLNWETDANDVDFHIHDGNGGHAFYSSPHLFSGGDLYADVTTGYGPECFTIRGPAARRASPYRLQAHYYSRGPMGYGMGKLQIIDHDGHGRLRFDERPFVIMKDGAFVDLGTVAATAIVAHAPALAR